MPGFSFSTYARLAIFLASEPSLVQPFPVIFSDLFATDVPTNGAIPISNGSGAADASLDGWVTNGSGGGGGGGGDICSNLQFPETQITGAISLSSSDFGHQFFCTGANTSYQVDLPSATGNAGKIIGIRVANQSPSPLVTLSHAGGIDGTTTRVMQLQEEAVLLCDGTSYTKIAGKTLPMICQISRTSNQTIGTVTATKVDCNQTDIDSNGRMADIANGRFFIRRTGLYALQADITTTAGSAFGSQNQIRIHRNGAFDFNRATIDIGMILVRYPAFVIGDYIELYTFSVGGYTLFGDGSKATAVLVCEVPQW